MTFRLAHISDVHLGPLPKVRKRELVGKRITGYLNWQRNRAHDMGSDTLHFLLKALENSGYDHLAITGDLINIGLNAEFEAAGKWLKENFDPEKTSIVPGNHDAYVRGTLAKALQVWEPFLTGDDGAKTLKSTNFPYLRIRENVAIIGASSAIATPVFVAGGRFGVSQAKRLSSILQKTGEQGLFRVIMIHHPPVRNATPPRKRLYGIGLFQDVIAKHGAELILHGHTHLDQRHEIRGTENSLVPVIGVPSASQSLGSKRPPSAYNLFEISGSSGHWKCTMKEHSLTNASGAFSVTETRQIITAA